MVGKQSANENEKILKENIMVGFDPENNEQDRRILYEVMGMRIYRGEFHENSSSESDGEEGDA